MSVSHSTNSNKPPGQKPGDAGQETSKENAPTAAKASIVPISNSTRQKAGDSPGEPKHAETSCSSRSKTKRFSTSSNNKGTKPSKADELQKSIENAERMKKPTGTQKQIADDLVLQNTTTELKKTPTTKKKRVAPELEASEKDIHHKKARMEDADEVSSLSPTKRRSANKKKVQDTVDLTLNTTLGTSIPTRDMLRRYYGWEWKYGKLEIVSLYCRFDTVVHMSGESSF
jgi:hypothetical protein